MKNSKQIYTPKPSVIIKFCIGHRKNGVRELSEQYGVFHVTMKRWRDGEFEPRFNDVKIKHFNNTDKIAEVINELRTAHEIDANFNAFDVGEQFRQKKES